MPSLKHLPWTQKQKRTPAPCVNVAVHRPHSSGFVSTTSFGLAVGEPLSVRNKYCSHFCQRSLMAVLPAGFATLKYKIQKGKMQEYKMQEEMEGMLLQCSCGQFIHSAYCVRQSAPHHSVSLHSCFASFLSPFASFLHSPQNRAEREAPFTSLSEQVHGSVPRPDHDLQSLLS